jgi:hypothetical protein
MNKNCVLANVFVAVTGICGVPSLPAQTPASTGIPVHTVVTVESRHGSTTPDVSREDVLVHEGKERDTVTEWIPAHGDSAALEFFILLDDGSNVSLGSQLEDIRQFILAQPASAKVGLAYMQNGIAKIAQNPTSDHEQVAKALRLPLGAPGVNGSPYFSLSDLVKRWPAGAPRREVLMVSDGIDRYYGSGDYLDPTSTRPLKTHSAPASLFPPFTPPALAILVTVITRPTGANSTWPKSRKKPEGKRITSE